MSDPQIPEPPNAEKPLVVIAGASGFVGQALAGPLSRHFRVVGMARSPGPAGAPWSEWRRRDLLNLREAEEGLAGASVFINQFDVHADL